VTRAYDPHNLPIQGRTPMAPPWPQQVAMQKAKHEEHLNQVEVLVGMGYSQVSISKALGVSRKTVSRLMAEGRQRRVIENVSSLTDRLDEAVLIRRQLFNRAQEIINDRKALNKDKVAAIEQASHLRDAIEDLEGTKASDKITLAALAEVSDVFRQAFAQVLPEQQNLIMQLLMQRLRGTQQGALLMGALASNAPFYIDAEEDEADPEPEEGESDADTGTPDTDETLDALDEDQDEVGQVTPSADVDTESPGSRH
jgi:predicted transcriptional regulator